MLKIIKPEIINTMIALPYLLGGLFISIIGIILMVLPISNDDPKMGVTILSVILIIFILYVAINFVLKREALKSTSYEFREGEIHYIDGFLNKNRKVIEYKNITDIMVRQTLIERYFGVGTVLISSAGSIGYEISMPYLRYYDQVRKFIVEKRVQK